MNFIKFEHYETSGTPGIYKEGWKRIIDSGFHPPMKKIELEEFNSVIIAKLQTGRHLGILSYYINEACINDEICVSLIYVRDEGRRLGIATHLHSMLVEKFPDNRIEYVVNWHNSAARNFYYSLGLEGEYITYVRN